MITRAHMPCPQCGHRWTWQAVLATGQQARECPACGWSEVGPVPDRRR